MYRSKGADTTGQAFLFTRIISEEEREDGGEIHLHLDATSRLALVTEARQCRGQRRDRPISLTESPSRTAVDGTKLHANVDRRRQPSNRGVSIADSQHCNAGGGENSNSQCSHNGWDQRHWLGHLGLAGRVACWCVLVVDLALSWTSTWGIAQSRCTEHKGPSGKCRGSGKGDCDGEEHQGRGHLGCRELIALRCSLTTGPVTSGREEEEGNS